MMSTLLLLGVFPRVVETLCYFFFLQIVHFFIFRGVYPFAIDRDTDTTVCTYV